MATLKEARSQVNQAKQQIAEARRKTQEARQKAEKSRSQLAKKRASLPERKSQRALRDKMSGLQGRQARRNIKKVEDEISSRVKKIQEYKKGLKKYEEETIKPFEEKIKKADIELKAEEAKQRDYEIAKKIAYSDFPGAIFALETDRQREYYRQIKEGIEVRKQWATQAKTVKDTTGLSLQEFKSISPEALSKLSSTDLAKLESVGLVKTDLTKLNDRQFKMETKDLMADTISLDPQKSLVRDDRSFIDKAKSFVGNIFEKGDKSGSNFAQGMTGMSVVSAYSGEDIKSISKPEKTFTQKVTDLPSNILKSARDFSEQQARLVSAEKDFGIGNVETIGGRDVTTTIQRVATRPTQLRKIETNINKLDLDIKKLEQGKINNLGQFTGSESDYNKLQNLYNKRENLYNKFQERKDIKVGFLGTDEYSATTDARRFETKNPFDVVTLPVKVGVSTIAGTAENLYFKVRKGDVGKEVSYVEPQFGTIQTDPTTGEQIALKEKKGKITAEMIKKESKFFGNVAEFGGDVGVYAVPYLGAGVFASDVGSFGTEATKSIKSGQGLSAGQLVEGGLLLGFSALGARSAVKGFRRSRQFKSLTKAEPQISLGLEKDGSLLFISERTGKGIKSRQVQRFDIVGSGAKAQVRAGKGVQEIKRDSLLFRDAITETTPFTFAGKVEKTTGRLNKMPIEDDVFVSQLRVISGTEKLSVSKPRGFGVSRTKDISTKPKIIDGVVVFGQEGEFTFGFGGLLKESKAIKQPDIVAYFPKGEITLKSPVTGFRAGAEEGFALRKIKSEAKQIEILGLPKGKKTKTTKTDSGTQFKQFEMLETEKGVASGTVARTAEESLLDTSKQTQKTTFAFDKKATTQITKTQPKNQEITMLQSKQLQEVKPAISLVKTKSLGLDSRSKSLDKLKPISLEKTELKKAESFKQKSSQIFRESLKQDLMKKQKRQSITETLKPKPKPKIKPKLKPKLKKAFSLVSGETKPTEKERGIFEAVGIRFGKEVKLGKGTKKQAEKKLESFLTGTLGASGFLKSKGKKAESKLLGKKEFRKSKLDPFKVVEVKEKRLKKGTKETEEIQLFKKKGKKAKNLLSI